MFVSLRMPAIMICDILSGFPSSISFIILSLSSLTCYISVYLFSILSLLFCIGCVYYTRKHKKYKCDAWGIK